MHDDRHDPAIVSRLARRLARYDQPTNECGRHGPRPAADGERSDTVSDITTTERDANTAAVERMRQVYASGDFAQIEEAALEYYTDETVDTFPQSGEVFQGLALVKAMSDAYSEATGTRPTFALREIRGRDDLWVLEGTIDYGNGTTAESVAIVELRDGKVVRQTDYFAAPFEAPEWRKPFRKAPK
jgi:hypothetical protein